MARFPDVYAMPCPRCRDGTVWATSAVPHAALYECFACGATTEALAEWLEANGIPRDARLEPAGVGDGSEKYLETELARCRRELGIGRLCYVLGALWRRRLNGQERAHDYFQRAWDIYERARPPLALEWAELATDRGEVATQRGQHEMAYRSFVKLFEVASAHAGDALPLLADCARLVGEAARAGGDEREAQVWFRHELELLEAAAGSEESRAYLAAVIAQAWHGSLPESLGRRALHQWRVLGHHEGKDALASLRMMAIERLGKASVGTQTPPHARPVAPVGKMTIFAGSGAGIEIGDTTDVDSPRAPPIQDFRTTIPGASIPPTSKSAISVRAVEQASTAQVEQEGAAAMMRGDWATAIARYEVVVPVRRASGTRDELYLALGNLASALVAAGMWPRAIEVYGEYRELTRARFGDHDGLTLSLEPGWIHVLVRTGDAIGARRLADELIARWDKLATSPLYAHPAAPAPFRPERPMLTSYEVCVMIALEQLGDLYLALGDKAAARRAFDRLLPLLRARDGAGALPRRYAEIA